MGKKTAMILGWIFVVLGVLGFVPNPLVGEGALFHADTNHNIVHLILGAILLWAAYKAAAKVGKTMLVVGVVYLLVALAGFFSDSGTVLGLMEINSADNWLHLVLALVLISAGKKAGRGGMSQTM